jgi:hypothetical protein
MLLHPPDQSRAIREMSWWAVGTGLLGISHGKVALGSCVLIGSGIAYMYWSHPTYGWRRNLDMTWIQILLWWHLWAARMSPVRALYYGISAAGAVAYGVSWYCMRRGHMWAAVWGHMLLTACANLSLTVLYSHEL